MTAREISSPASDYIYIDGLRTTAREIRFVLNDSKLYVFVDDGSSWRVQDFGSVQDPKDLLGWIYTNEYKHWPTTEPPNQEDDPWAELNPHPLAATPERRTDPRDD